MPRPKGSKNKPKEAPLPTLSEQREAILAQKADIEDTISALERIEHGQTPGPSYNTLRKTLREGRLFAIVTARGHAPETIEKAVRVFIRYALTESDRQEMMANLRGYRRWLDKVDVFGTDAEELDYYLSMCRYSAVTNDAFKQRMARDPVYREKLA